MRESRSQLVDLQLVTFQSGYSLVEPDLSCQTEPEFGQRSLLVTSSISPAAGCSIQKTS